MRLLMSNGVEQAIITRRPNDFRLVGVPEKRVIDQSNKLHGMILPNN